MIKVNKVKIWGKFSVDFSSMDALTAFVFSLLCRSKIELFGCTSLRQGGSFHSELRSSVGCYGHASGDE